MITVADLEGLEGLGLRIVAGAAGATRSIRWVASTELADPTPWLRGGELLLTIGLAAEESGDAGAYVERLSAAGLAGLGFALGIRSETIPAAMHAAAERLGFPLLEVPYATPFVAITEAVMTRIVNEQYAQLERAMAVHDALVGLVLEEAGLEAIVAATAEAVGASVGLVGRDGRILASADRGPPLGPVAARATQPAGAPLGDHALALDVGVSAPGEAILVAAFDRPVRDWDRVQLQQARTVLALELAKRRAIEETERRIAGDLVEELLSGSADDRLTGRRLRAYGLDDAPALAVIVARPDTAAGAPALLGRITEALARAGVPAIATVRHGEVCAIVAADDDLAAETAARSIVNRPAREGRGVRLGVSRARTRIRDLGEAHEEAWYALEARADSARADDPVATVRDLGSVGLLLALHDEPGLELFCRATLGTLDAPNGRAADALVPTLVAFIDANGNASVAAERLGVHRHTLRHRLARIERATGRDLASASDRLDLSLALKAREMAARR